MIGFSEFLLEVLVSFPVQGKSSVCWNLMKYMCDVNASLGLRKKYIDILEVNIVLLEFSKALSIGLRLFLLIQWESSFSFKILPSQH